MPSNNLVRTYSASSVGCVTSGRQDRHSLTEDERLEEFSYHSERFQRERKTALISTTDYLLWALKEAFNRYYSGEAAETIFIAFIHVPDEHEDLYYHGKILAESAHIWQDPELFTWEYLFQWEILAESIMHTVSLQTLINRKLLHRMRWLDLDV
jgi:hypothetical protein